MVKIPADFNGKIKVNAREFRAVVIEGGIIYASTKAGESIDLSPGSYFGSTDANDHTISTTKGAVVYIRTDGAYRVISN